MMTSILALLLAIAFVGVAIYRLSPSATPLSRNVQLACALGAGLFGIAVFSGSDDSRWLVGGILMIGAGVPGHLAGSRRALRIVALICGILGLALFGIATARPMATVPAISPAAT